jgi:hypothetical protein
MMAVMMQSRPKMTNSGDVDGNRDGGGEQNDGVDTCSYEVSETRVRVR